MEWFQFLLVLICPLMMIICMKGHMGGQKGHRQYHESNGSNDLGAKVIKLQEENTKLRKEISDLALLIKKQS
ncbi:MAG: DUF2933 domain-containing protein [Thermotaleaceae bacterium]|jgi:hypothetical protein